MFLYSKKDRIQELGWEINTLRQQMGHMQDMIDALYRKLGASYQITPSHGVAVTEESPKKR